MDAVENWRKTGNVREFKAVFPRDKLWKTLTEIHSVVNKLGLLLIYSFWRWKIPAGEAKKSADFFPPCPKKPASYGKIPRHKTVMNKVWITGMWIIPARGNAALRLLGDCSSTVLPHQPVDKKGAPQNSADASPLPLPGAIGCAIMRSGGVRNENRTD